MTNSYFIRPDKNGLRAVLFDLEADIMEVVWSGGAEWSVGEVQEVLRENRDIAYTTVMTTVTRLYEKGLLERRKDGRRYLYTPSQTRDEFLAALATDVFDRLPEVSKEAASAFLVDRVSESDLEELDRLEELIRRRREEVE